MPSTTETETRVRAIIAELAMLDIADVGLGNTMEDLGLDSMALVEALFAIEEEFDIQVPFNANEPQANDFDISSVQAIVTGVHNLVAEKS